MPKNSKTRFTNAYIKSLAPKTKRYEVYDAKQPGFGLRISASGRKSWIIIGRQNGEKIRVTIGTYPTLSLAAARVQATEIAYEMLTGNYIQNKRSHIFEDVLQEWYLREQKLNKSFKQVDNAIQLNVMPSLKGRKVDEITKADLLKIIDRIADRGAIYQANRVRAFMSRFFSWCCERDILKQSPATSLPRVSGEIARDRVLKDRELHAVWNSAVALGYPFGVIIQLLILTGQRLNEVAGMKKSEVDLETGLWTIEASRSKNRHNHTVHLSKLALQILHTAPTHGEGDFLFTTTGHSAVSGFSKFKKRLDKKSGVEAWRIHDLRRTVATVMSDRLSIQPFVVDRILNHRSGAIKGVAAVYQKGEFLEQRKQALLAWSQFVEQMCLSDKAAPL